MIWIFSSAEDAIAVRSGRQNQLIQSTLVNIGYRLRVLIRAVSSQIEREFAVFANVPYHDSRSRQQWEELWKTDPGRRTG
jgi:hypothetical protein